MGDVQIKVALAGLVSILMVTAVVGQGDNKTVDSICKATDFKDLCRESMAKAKSNDPKELIQSALDYTINNIDKIIKESELFKKAAADPNTKKALKICEKVLDRAIGDLKRTIKGIGVLKDKQADDLVSDLKTWLSAVITWEETCIDAFDDTKGDTAEKIKELLKTTMELSSNGLALLDSIQSLLETLGVGDMTIGDIADAISSFTGSSSGRKLLWYEQRQLGELVPNAVVALDGSGQFKTINDAIATVPMKNDKPFVILVKAGLYKEVVKIQKKQNFIVLLGEGADKTRITASLNNRDGVKTFESATVAVDGEDFTAKDIAIENSAGPEGHQAVALRISGDRAIVHNVVIDGYQDTLYAHNYRQLYRACKISGTVDFVFGDALAIFQKCNFIVRKPMPGQGCMVTAQGRVDPRSQGATVIHGSTIEAEPAFLEANPPIKAYLGRPWKMYARTIVMFSEIGGFIQPDGWSPWNGDLHLDTLFYAEYMNKGPGADKAKRVIWKGYQKDDQFGAKEAEKWAVSVQFAPDIWLKNSGVPYWPTLEMLPY